MQASGKTTELRYKLQVSTSEKSHTHLDTRNVFFSALQNQSIDTRKITNLNFCFPVPVSIARSVLSYNSDDARILSFRPSETITVYSKSAGNRPDLWGAEVTQIKYLVEKFPQF
jgi:hypothetical protein